MTSAGQACIRVALSGPGVGRYIDMVIRNVVSAHMESTIVVVLIAMAASIVVPSITFFLTKKKEREVEWRKLRVEQYKELMDAMSNVAGESPSAESRKRLALTANQVGLFASPAVLRQMTRLLNAVAAGSGDNQDEIITSLIHAIRTDLKVPDAGSHEDIQLRLWGAGGQDSAL